MRQKLKQQSASIVKIANHSGSSIPFKCKGELQAVKVDKENKPENKEKVKSSETEFSFSDLQSSVENQEDVCASTSMVKTVDSMLDEVNRIMHQAASDHDKNVHILKAAEDLPFNECMGGNGTSDHLSGNDLTKELTAFEEVENNTLNIVNSQNNIQRKIYSSLEKGMCSREMEYPVENESLYFFTIAQISFNYLFVIKLLRNEFKESKDGHEFDEKVK